MTICTSAKNGSKIYWCFFVCWSVAWLKARIQSKPLPPHIQYCKDGSLPVAVWLIQYCCLLDHHFHPAALSQAWAKVANTAPLLCQVLQQKSNKIELSTQIRRPPQQTKSNQILPLCGGRRSDCQPFTIEKLYNYSDSVYRVISDCSKLFNR